MSSQFEMAQARRQSAEDLGKFVRDFQAEQFKRTAISVAPGLALAAQRAHQQSVARANESIAQQQQMNHQLWIQNQLLAGRSMEDIQAQIDAEQAACQAQAPQGSLGLGLLMLAAAAFILYFVVYIVVHNI